MSTIAQLRREYSSTSLLEKDVAPHPIDQFSLWWSQALETEIVDANAMTLATASGDGMPCARVVLLKGYDRNGFIFFSNYKSFKSVQMEENPKACLLFYWKEVERQVRIIGLVDRIPEEDSDAYFSTRPVGSQIGAWTSPQSQVIRDRDWLDNHYLEIAEKFSGKPIARPPYWGGYIVKPVILEFWQGRPSRLHDRIQYTLQEDGSWKTERLAP